MKNSSADFVGNREFITLMALLMSITAFTIDAILPALNIMGQELAVLDSNDTQLIISTVFAGMAFGLLLFGPYSDSFGRKNSMFLGIGIFLIGTLISIFTSHLSIMLVGRFLQGFGSSACRIGSISMVRDRFEGRQMGRIVSLILIFFILVPAVAPTLGNLILLVSGWRVIFGFMFLLGTTGLIWLYFRQKETLAIENRRDFSVLLLKSGIIETIKNPIARGYTIANGLMFGAFIGYLTTAQQTLQIQYALGDQFAYFFGFLALAIGVASFTNAKLVIKWGMEKLCTIALVIIVVISALFFIYCQIHNGQPPLAAFMTYLSLTFFCMGFLFGNFGSLAIQPLGHIAGLANSIIASFSTSLSVIIGAYVGSKYVGNVNPLVAGFLICGIMALVVTVRTIKITGFEIRQK
jgi:MFS transporter, DHA1 family, multidrug resistance protein